MTWEAVVLLVLGAAGTAVVMWGVTLFDVEGE